jgi:GNAT superfamily N-acetyltransferase
VIIRSLNAAALLDFIASPDFRTLPVLPIAPLRARAQARNPRARAEDPLLFLASAEDGSLLGYLGTLPGRAAGQPVAWLSCIWTSPAARGRGVAKKLVRTAYAAYEGRLLLTEFTGPAKQLYDRLGLFRPLREQPGLRLYFRSCLGAALPPRGRVWARLAPLWRTADRLLNILLDQRLRYSPAAVAPAGWSRAEGLTAELAEWIAARQPEEWFPRTPAELHWLLDHPWVFTGPDPERIASRYHFTARADRFSTEIWALRGAAEEVRAIVILRQKDREGKLIAAYFAPRVAEAVARGIVHWCIQRRLNWFTTYDARLLPVLRTLGPALYRRERTRLYYQSDRLAAAWKQAPTGRIQDGDGDVFGV